MRDFEKLPFSETSGRIPFKTPDSYFDNLTARIMDTIPEEKIEHNKRKFGMRWVTTVAVAASFALVAVVSIKLFDSTKAVGNDGAENVNMAANIYGDEEMTKDEMMLYSMVDNSDIYNYLAGYEY